MNWLGEATETFKDKGRCAMGRTIAIIKGFFTLSGVPDATSKKVQWDRMYHPQIVLMGVVVSMGGFMFGYDTGAIPASSLYMHARSANTGIQGQISGNIQISDYRQRFGDNRHDGLIEFSTYRAATIISMIVGGGLFGALFSQYFAEKLGRKPSIFLSCFLYAAGVAIQVSSYTAWYQLVIGRAVGGLGVGALSILTPMYLTETAPEYARGILVSCYQLFIAIGLFLAYGINLRTSKISGWDSWRIPIGIGLIWPCVMSFGMCFLSESPRWDLRKESLVFPRWLLWFLCKKKNQEKDLRARARETIARSYGVVVNDPEVEQEVREIDRQVATVEHANRKRNWSGLWSDQGMLYRMILGVVLQALQQLTGINFFFYYGTSIFANLGIENSFKTSLILGGVNLGSTILGLYLVGICKRRWILIGGSIVMSCSLMIFTCLGSFCLDREHPESDHSTKVGIAMIVFACVFIFGFATTWGPVIWLLCGEIYPNRLRAKAMAIATGTNWGFNFWIMFSTPFITEKINYKWGFVFTGCTIFGGFVSYFFVLESRGRSLEEIDMMYKQWSVEFWDRFLKRRVTRSNPIVSAHRSKSWAARRVEIPMQERQTGLNPGSPEIENRSTRKSVSSKEEASATTSSTAGEEILMAGALQTDHEADQLMNSTHLRRPGSSSAGSCTSALVGRPYSSCGSPSTDTPVDRRRYRFFGIPNTTPRMAPEESPSAESRSPMVPSRSSDRDSGAQSQDPMSSAKGKERRTPPRTPSGVNHTPTVPEKSPERGLGTRRQTPTPASPDTGSCNQSSAPAIPDRSSGHGAPTQAPSVGESARVLNTTPDSDEDRPPISLRSSSREQGQTHIAQNIDPTDHLHVPGDERRA